MIASMFAFYCDYFWQNGKPFGIQKAENKQAKTNVFRIVSDPYHKWLTIEEYEKGHFANIVYDSRLLDFRKLTPMDQLAWRKEPMNAFDAWIFNEDDRLILKECCLYEKGVCIGIKIYSPYSNLLCYYKMPGGPLGQVTLLDSRDRQVMTRSYNRTTGKYQEKW